MKPPEPATFMFADDGAVPNNPKLPLIFYRRAFDLSRTKKPEELIEKTFRANGWGREMWRDGIYPYVHYHSMIHEALGVARGSAKIRFGGEHGKIVDVEAGDVAILPAGTGHHGLATSADFCLIGAYPPEGQYNLFRASKSEHAAALETIPHVAVPKSDPLAGKNGPLTRLWT